MILQHGNARLYCAALSKIMILELGKKALQHLLYYPDFVLSIFYFFYLLSNALRELLFINN